MNKHKIQTACLALILAGCGLLGLDSDESKEPISFDLVLDKTVIAPGERFTATYTARNRSDISITFSTGCAAFASISGVFHDGKQVNFHGSLQGCYTGLSQYVIGPKESLQFNWDIDAFRRIYEVGQPFDTIFVAPGDYSLRVISHISQMNGKYLEVEPMEVDFKVE